MINLIEHALLSAVIIGDGVIRASPSEYLMANDWCSAHSSPGFLIADETGEHRVERGHSVACEGAGHRATLSFLADEVKADYTISTPTAAALSATPAPLSWPLPLCPYSCLHEAPPAIT